MSVQTNPIIQATLQNFSKNDTIKVSNDFTSAGPLDQYFGTFDVRNLLDQEKMKLVIKNASSIFSKTQEDIEGQPLGREVTLEEQIMQAQKIDSPSIRFHALGSIAEKLCEAGNVDEAYRVFTMQIKTIREFKKVDDQLSAVAYLAGYLAKNDMEEMTEYLYYQLISAVEGFCNPLEKNSDIQRSYAFEKMAESVAEAKISLETASRILEKMIQSANKLYLGGDKGWALLNIATSLARLGMKGRAGEISDQAVTAVLSDLNYDSRSRANSLEILAYNLAKNGMPEKAEEVRRKIK